MKHLTEEELIECFYNKNKAANPASRHLEQCVACAEAYAALESDLALITPAEPPARDAAYGERVWRSIAPCLPVYEVRKRSWLRGGAWRVLSYASACALLIACAFIAGRVWEHKQLRTTAGDNLTTIPQPAAPPQQRLVVVVLSDHLDRSERLLVELKHADAGSEELISPLRDEARSLLAANRVCRQNAEKDDDPALTAALARLDHLLAELANQQGGLNAAALARLQEEMNSGSLLFEVRVLRSRIPNQQPAANNRPKGGTI
jgi:hypothetical protein